MYIQFINKMKTCDYCQPLTINGVLSILRYVAQMKADSWLVGWLAWSRPDVCPPIMGRAICPGEVG